MLDWLREHKAVAFVAGIIVLGGGVFLFFFFQKSPTTDVSMSDGSISSSLPTQESIIKERAKLPPPLGLDPDAWPEKIILKTPDGMDRVIVYFKYSTNQQTQRDTIASYGGKVLIEFDSDVYAKQILVPESQREALGKDLAVYKIESDEPVKMVQAQTVPPSVTDLKVPDLWGKTPNITGSGVTVAVLDSGTDPDNPDLGDSGCSWSALPNNSSVIDEMGHGTHVAGTIAAKENSKGVKGVAPDAKLCIIRIFDSIGGGDESTIALAIDKAVDLHSQVINISAGVDGASANPPQQPKIVLTNAVANAISKGVVIVAATGNTNASGGKPKGIFYPASMSGVIAVTAVDSSNTKPANYPDGAITLSAPGVDILSDCLLTDDGCNDLNIAERRGTMTGTSMASPFVAGAVALLLSQPMSDENKAKYDTGSKDGQWQPAEVKAALQATAKPLGPVGPTGRNDQYGYGLVNVAALLAAGPTCQGTPPDSSKATLCTDDEKNLPATPAVTYSAVSTCTAKKCEYTCKSGYVPNNTGTDCVLAPTCTGAPANATLCSGDGAGLTVDTPGTLVTACTVTTPAKCKYTCNTGYKLESGQCVVDSTTTPPLSSLTKGVIPCGTAANPEPCTVCHIIVGGQQIITWGLKVMTIIALAVIVAMAVFYVVSIGDEGMMTTAKGGIKAALIGFAVMLGAWLIINVTLKIFSATIKNLTVSSTGFTFTCNTASTAATVNGGGGGATKENGQCGATVGLCSKGNASNVTSTTWTCDGVNGGLPTNCS